jgi:hypothetical protein
MTQSARRKGVAPIIIQILSFCCIVEIFIDIKPVNNGFSPFWGDIGHFLSPNFGRKLGMDNQLQIYINQACLRP